MRALTPCLFVFIGCGGAGKPIDAAVVPRSTPAPAVVEPAPAPAPTADARFPAGPGVTLVYDQLTDLYRDRTITDSRVPYKDRVAAAAKALGVDGEEVDGGAVWHAVGAKHIGGPFNCNELAVLQSGGIHVGATDHRLCGLPYGERLSKPYTGPGPRFTRVRLERILVEVAALPPDQVEGMLRARLGPPDIRGVIEPVGTTPSADTWSAVGARDDEAPITCHLLVLRKDKPRLEQHDLADCGIAWPPPPEAFAAEPAPPPMVLSKAVDECSTRCGASDICVVEQRVPRNATMVTRNDRIVAYGWDGRPVAVTRDVSCAPIPSTCASPVTSACFFGGPPRPGPGPFSPPSKGPCPPANNYGHSFTTAPTGRPMITCYTRTS